MLLQGCFIKCEILRSPMISYQSLLFIVTTMNDKCTYAQPKAGSLFFFNEGIMASFSSKVVSLK